MMPGIMASRPLGGGGGGGHRYWRFQSTASDGGGAILAMAGLQFLDATGTPLAGTYSALGTTGGSLADLTDGNLNTYWWYAALPAWVQIDLGAGNEAVVDAIRVQARNDGFSQQCALTGQLQYSDDGSTVTDVMAFDEAHWANGRSRIIKRSPYIFRFVWDDPQGANTFTTLSELEIRASIGGADLTNPVSTEIDWGRVYGKRGASGETPDLAFNNNTADYFGNAGNPDFTEWRFDSDPGVAEVALTARTTFQAQAPESFKILHSTDGGLNYTQIYQSASLSWTSGETKALAI